MNALVPLADIASFENAAFPGLRDVPITAEEGAAALHILNRYDSVRMTVSPRHVAREILAVVGNEEALQAFALAVQEEIQEFSGVTLQDGQLIDIDIQRVDDERDLSDFPQGGHAITRFMAFPADAETSARGDLLPRGATEFCRDALHQGQRILVVQAVPGAIEEAMTDDQVSQLGIVQQRMLAEAMAASMQSLEAQVSLIGALKHIGGQIAAYQQGGAAQKKKIGQDLRVESRGLMNILERAALQASALPPGQQQLGGLLREFQKRLAATGAAGKNPAAKVTASTRSGLAQAQTQAKFSRAPAVAKTGSGAKSSVSRTPSRGGIIAGRTALAAMAVMTPLSSTQKISAAPATIPVAMRTAFSSPTLGLTPAPAVAASAPAVSVPTASAPNSLASASVSLASYAAEAAPAAASITVAPPTAGASDTVASLTAPAASEAPAAGQPVAEQPKQETPQQQQAQQSEAAVIAPALEVKAEPVAEQPRQETPQAQPADIVPVRSEPAPLPVADNNSALALPQLAATPVAPVADIAPLTDKGPVGNAPRTIPDAALPAVEPARGPADHNPQPVVADGNGTEIATAPSAQPSVPDSKADPYFEAKQNIAEIAERMEKIVEADANFYRNPEFKELSAKLQTETEKLPPIEVIKLPEHKKCPCGQLSCPVAAGSKADTSARPDHAGNRPESRPQLAA